MLTASGVGLLRNLLDVHVEVELAASREESSRCLLDLLLVLGSFVTASTVAGELLGQLG